MVGTPQGSVSERLKRSCASGCTSRSRPSVNGCRRLSSGYYQYHAVPGNMDRLRVFGQRLRRLWRLDSKSVAVNGANAALGSAQPDLEPLDSSTSRFASLSIGRFVATHPRWEPYA